MNFDISQINNVINETVAKVQAYFKSLSQYELYAWIGVAVGFVLVLIALITW